MSYKPETMCSVSSCVRVNPDNSSGLCVGHDGRRKKGTPLDEKPLRGWAGSASARGPLHGPPTPCNYMQAITVRIRSRHTCRQCGDRFTATSPSNTTYCSTYCSRKWSFNNHSQGKNRKAQRAVSRHHRRALEANARTERIVAADLYARWEEADLYGCLYCGAPWEHHDHYTPLNQGGPHSMDNIVPACGSCNSSKSDHDPVEWFFSVGPGAQPLTPQEV